MADSIFPTPFKLATNELLLSSAATILFQQLQTANPSQTTIADLCASPQYGHTDSARIEAVGPRFVRITDIKGGTIDWDSVPYCFCNEPEKYLLKPGDILVARAGSVGKSFLVSVVPETAVFASYMIRLCAKPETIPDFVYWFFQTQQFWLQVAGANRGSAMGNINGKMLAGLVLPVASQQQQQAITNFLNRFRDMLGGKVVDLPDLTPPFQNAKRIVARVDALARRVEEARGLRRAAAVETLSFASSLHLSLAGPQTVMLGDILVLDENREEVVGGHTYPQVGIKGFGLGLFHRETVDITQTRYKWFNHLYYGATVMSQVKGWEGAIAVCLTEFADEYASPEYRTFRCISGKALPDYLAVLFSTPWFWAQLKDLGRGVGGRRERLRPERFLEMKLPMPDVHAQRQAISAFQKLDALKRLQAETQKELDALMPSILAKAFAGEL